MSFDMQAFHLPDRNEQNVEVAHDIQYTVENSCKARNIGMTNALEHSLGTVAPEISGDGHA